MGLVFAESWRSDMNVQLLLRLTLVVLLVLAGVQTTIADLTYEEESTDRGSLRIFKMTITPAPEPVPAMQYRLTVPPHKTIPGNAITHYLRSYGENSLDAPWKGAREKYDDVFDWYSNDIAIKDLPLDKLRDVSSMFDSYVSNHIARATICRFVDWGLAEEELTGLGAIEFLLPSVQQTRSISRALALRTRFAIAENRFDDAIDHMRMNYRLAENVGRMKFLVADLVGMAEVGMTHQTMNDGSWQFRERPVHIGGISGRDEIVHGLMSHADLSHSHQICYQELHPTHIFSEAVIHSHMINCIIVATFGNRQTGP